MMPFSRWNRLLAAKAYMSLLLGGLRVTGQVQ